MSRPETSPTAADPLPEGVAVGLTCPTCGYDLHGLTTPRCPECGLAFRWDDLIEARRAGPPWLFERAARRRAWAFVQTYARTGLPWYFWRRVTRENPVRLGRLVLYWLLVSLPLVWVALATTPALVVIFGRRSLAVRAQYVVLRQLPASRPIPTQAQIDAMFPAPWTAAFVRQAEATVAQEVGAARVAAAAVPILWPWLTAAALLACRRALRRAGVGPADVVRTAVYGCDFGLIAITVAGALYSVRDLPVVEDLLAPAFGSGRAGKDAALLALMILATAAVATVRLAIAAGLYLQLARPVRTVAVVQAIVTAATVLVLFPLLRPR